MEDIRTLAIGTTIIILIGGLIYIALSARPKIRYLIILK